MGGWGFGGGEGGQGREGEGRRARKGGRGREGEGGPDTEGDPQVETHTEIVHTRPRLCSSPRYRYIIFEREKETRYSGLAAALVTYTLCFTAAYFLTPECKSGR